MDIFIPTENDIRRWVKEAVKECFEELLEKNNSATDNINEFLSRKQVAKILDISLVTLTDWMKKGLPYHKPNRRVYFIKDEVMDYMKKQKN